MSCKVFQGPFNIETTFVSIHTLAPLLGNSLKWPLRQASPKTVQLAPGDLTLSDVNSAA